MSEFIGIVSNDINFLEAENALKEMSHRGTNQNDLYFNENKNVCLGHNQLIIFDDEHSKQPFYFKEFVLVFDGRLYNSKELREDLKIKGHTFSGHSDAEVLIKMFAENKENCLEKLNGVFSFVIWDELKKEIFGCRDRLGAKPFYYYFKKGKKNFKPEFMVSSKIKSILKYCKINSLPLNGLREILGLGPSHTAGCGIFSDVYELKPAHYLKFKPEIQNDNAFSDSYNNITHKKLIIKKYWKLPTKTHIDNFDTTVLKTRILLTDSIYRQLNSNTSLCSFLSGGLDSTIITLIAKNRISDLETFSVDYQKNKKYFIKNDYQVSEDVDFIKILIEKFKLKHKFLTINNKQLTENLFNVLCLKDFPSMVDIDSSLFLFCQKVKKHYNVALSGEGSDEIFGGYPWFYKEQSEFFPWLRNLDERNLLINSKLRKKLDLINYVQEKFKQSIDETPLTGNETQTDKHHKQLTYLNLIWFTQTLLDRLDRMSAGVGLEVRMPFIDHRLVEYLFNVPWKYKYYKNKEKGLLREAFKDIVPTEILNRKKNPYPKTHNPKYLKSVKKLLKQRLKNKNSILNYIFDRQSINNLFEDSSKQKPWFGQLMTKPQLIAYLYQFDLWFEHYNLNLIE